MQRLLNRFTSVDNPNNVLLIPLPTGVGKTYNVMGFISDLIASGDERKVYYVTPLKKNLKSAKKDLEVMLKEKDVDSASIILNIDSITNYIIENYANVCKKYRNIKADIRDCFQNPEVFDDFDSKMECFIELKESSKKGYKITDKLIEKLKKDVLDAERKLRRTLHAILPRVEPEEKLKQIMQDGSKWYWIPLLYPSVFTLQRQVYFLSVDKFISIHDPIIDRAYKFYESATLNNSIIIFDEFDACKETMLKRIISDGLERIDYLGMFKTILLVLRDRQNIYVEYYRDSSNTISKKGEGHIRDKLEELYETAETLCREFDLDWSFKSKDPSLGNYIFHDFRSMTVGKTGEFKITVDGDRKVHDVRFDRNTYQSDFAITTLFSRLYSFFMKFNGFIRTQAENYIDLKKEDGTIIPLDAALNTMIVPFRFDKEQTDYILGNIRMMGRTKRTDTTRGYDASVYNTGIAYYDFEDDLSHDLSTTVCSTAFNITPEKILLKVLERSDVKVIGISATAILDSSVGNFHLHYLRHRAEWMEEIITNDEWKNLKEICNKSTLGYSKVNLIPKIINGEDEAWYSEDPSDDAVFHDPAAYSRVKMILMGIDEFARKRYLKLAKAYKYFIENEDMKSCLAFFSKSAKRKEKELTPNNPFSIEDIDKITRNIAEEHGKSIEIGKYGFEILNGLNDFEFDSKMEELKGRLYDGEKIFIITTYATVGAGQNLQYPRPEKGEFVEINQFKQKTVVPQSFSREDMMKVAPKKDFDGIYLDEPTMIAPVVRERNEDSLVRALFVIEFLMEGHEITEREAREAIKNAFKAFITPVGYTIKTKDTKSVKMSYARQIIQAIGRICRTNLKNKNIYLMADANLKKVFTDSIDSYGKLRNPEFEAIFKALDHYSGIRVDVKRQADGTDLASSRSFAEIQKYIKKKYWDSKLVEAWKDLRINVLKEPTADEIPGSMFYYSYYCDVDSPVDSLRYNEKYDYYEVTIADDGSKEVSALAARLDRLLAITGVREWFEENGYATTWKPNYRIMSPVLFHNIYLGALGEESGRAILDNWGIELEELPPSVYERFDFRINDEVYVDFKHHAGILNSVDYESELEHISEKLRFINETNGNTLAKKVYIINILENDGKYLPLKSTEKDGFTIIEIPYLYDKNNVRNKDAYSALTSEIPRRG